MKGFGLDDISETRCEAHCAQHTEFVLGEASLRITDGSNDASFEILASADKIQHLVCDRIEQQAVNCEVAAFHIFTWILAEANLIGMTAVAISDVTAKGGNLNDLVFVLADQAFR